MANQNPKEKAMIIIGNICLIGTFALYLSGMIFGNNLLFVCGIACGIAGVILGKMTEKNHVLVLSFIIAAAAGLELFMRVRDGYTGNGWYYLYLLQHPEANAWN
jgi:hypothetical protein